LLIRQQNLVKELITMSDPIGDSSLGDERARFPLVFGLDTFGDVTHGPDDRPLSHAQTIRHVVEQGVLAASK
jgi:hypothetical protein